MDIKNILPVSNRDDYQLDSFLSFLKAIKFEYNVPSIHIAGTNGKGSTANYLYNIYRENGYKVGLFSSPAFKDTNDMICCNGENITDEQIIAIVDQYRKEIEKYNLSLYEVITFVALYFFNKSGLDLAVIECCMGGELDATNVFVPLISVITSVSIEHTKFLGPSINSIATHKAGIIKNGSPVIIGNLVEEAEMVISNVAHDENSQVIKISPASNIRHNPTFTEFSYMTYIDVKIPYVAEYEIDNCCIALEVVNKLNAKYKTNEELTKKGIQKSNICARFEIVHDKPIVICDGAHNPEAINSLINSVEKVYGNEKIHIVFASFTDKNISIMLPSLSRLSNDITLTSFDNIRCRKDEDYFLFLEEYKYESDYKKVIQGYMQEFPDDLILVTGSLAFAFQVSNDFRKGNLK